MKRKGRKKWQWFLLSFSSTLCVLALFAGMIIAERNTRSVAFGDDTPLVSVEKTQDETLLKIDFFGSNQSINLTGAANALVNTRNSFKSIGESLRELSQGLESALQERAVG